MLKTSSRHVEFGLGRTLAYLRLITRKPGSVEVKRCVNTSLFKLRHLENSLHKSYVTAKFVSALIRYLKEMAWFLGPEECTFHSCGDQPKILIEILVAQNTASNIS